MKKFFKNSLLITNFLFLPILAFANSESDFLPKEKKETQYLISISNSFTTYDKIFITEAIENIKKYNQHAKMISTTQTEIPVNEKSHFKIINIREGDACISEEIKLDNKVFITINKEYCLTTEIITQMLSNIF